MPAGRPGQAGFVAYVPQGPLILDDTIRSNVAFGMKPESIEDDKAVSYTHLDVYKRQANHLVVERCAFQCVIHLVVIY